MMGWKHEVLEERDEKWCAVFCTRLDASVGAIMFISAVHGDTYTSQVDVSRGLEATITMRALSFLRKRRICGVDEGGRRFWLCIPLQYLYVAVPVLADYCLHSACVLSDSVIFVRRGGAHTDTAACSRADSFPHGGIGCDG